MTKLRVRAERGRDELGVIDSCPCACACGSGGVGNGVSEADPDLDFLLVLRERPEIDLDKRARDLDVKSRCACLQERGVLCLPSLVVKARKPTLAQTPSRKMRCGQFAVR